MENTQELNKITKRSNPKEWYKMNKERLAVARREKTGCKIKTVYNQKNNIKEILETKKAETTEHTLKKYISNLALLCQSIGEEMPAVLTFIQFAPDIICSTIDNLKKDDGTDYSDNTKQTIYSILNPVCKLMEIQLTEEVCEMYNKKMAELNFNYRHNKKKEMTTVSHISFPEYIERIATKFGVGSQQHILALIYSESTYRDDFINLIITNKPLSTNENYIIVTNSQVKVVINNHKTASTHGQLTHIYSRSIADAIRKYIFDNDLEYGMPLFPQQALSPVIHDMNKEVGIDGSTSVLRQMRVYENREASYEQRLELAQSMGHSLDVSLTIYEGSGKEN